MAEHDDRQRLLVLGLFDNERAADAALSKLAIGGVRDEAIEVIRRPDLEATEPPIPLPAYQAGASLGHLRPEPETLPSPKIVEEAAEEPVRELEGLLAGLELDDEAARYYAGAVEEGGTLVAIHAKDEAGAEAIRRWLADAGAASFNG
jgi:hypothetical protein